MVKLEEMEGAALADLVEKYPWFTAARVVLCCRALRESGRDAAESLYRDALAYLPCGETLSARITALNMEDYSDRDGVKVYDGTDFFSRGEYESVRRPGESSFGRLAKVDAAAQTPDGELPREDEEFDLITETLAEIYADQGYSDKAIEIYNSLSLQSPEKSAYFAALIRKLKS